MPVAPAPIAYLTCELKGRDLASRLLIASHILNSGYPVIVGQQWAMSHNLRGAPKGCFLFKSTNLVQADFMRRCKEAGHVVVAADEESLASARADFARNTHPETIRHCDLFLALSRPHSTALIEAYPDIESRISVVGNARVDILRSAQPPKPREGAYVLLNTSFGIINSVWGDAQRAAQVWIDAGGHAPGQETLDMIRERVSFEEASMRETKELLAWLLANTRLDIVVRPHPQERPEMWSTFDPSRVTVITGSDPVPWMRHALVTVHSESTTGVEAAIMGARALNLSPPGAWRDRLIVSEVNPTVPTSRQASNAIKKLEASGEWPASRTNAADLFPSGGARKTAEAIIGMLPPRGSLGAMKWGKLERTELQKTKFTVSLAEVQSLLPCRAIMLDDSIFYLEPPRAAQPSA